MKMLKSKTHNAGFTLIELLVVISIIALLLSIMMPSLNKARDAARKVVCMSNTRQIVTGVNVYAANHKDKYPYLYEDAEWARSWGTYGMCYVGNDGKYYPQGIGLLVKYGYVGNDVKFYYCPGRNKSIWPASYLFDKNSGWYTDTSGFSYPRSACYNLRGYDPTKGEQWKVGKSRQALTADIVLSYPVTVESHKKGVNVAYSDGSAGFVEGAEVLTKYNAPFFELIEKWAPTLAVRISASQHYDVYRFFDVQ